MEIVKLNVSDLVPNERNVRKHGDNQVKELVKAVKQFGIIRPIIVDENNVILCGHGLYRALVEMGQEQADCKVVSGLSEKQKTKLMLADNKIYDLGTNDYGMIDEILGELGLESDFDVPGYDAETLEELYGIKSIEEDAKVATEAPLPQKEQVMGESSPVSTGVPDIGEVTPSPSVQAARQEALSAKKVILCPHCGGTIEI